MLTALEKLKNFENKGLRKAAIDYSAKISELKASIWASRKSLIEELIQIQTILVNSGNEELHAIYTNHLKGEDTLGFARIKGCLLPFYICKGPITLGVNGITVYGAVDKEAYDLMVDLDSDLTAFYDAVEEEIDEAIGE